MAIQTGDNKWSVTNYIVDPVAGKGDFTTINDACAFFLANAITGVTCSIKSGTYTEDVDSLAPGITYTALGGSQSTPSVTIVGKITMTEAGTASIFGCRLQTNADYAIVVSGTNACILNISTSYFNVTDNTFLSYTNSNASSRVNVLNTMGDLTTTGIAYFEGSASSPLFFKNCNLTNTGGSTTANTISSGGISMSLSELFNPITSSSTAQIAFSTSVLDCSAINATAMTVGGSAGCFSTRSLYKSGTASAIVANAATTVDLIDVQSSNTNAISGSGTLNQGLISFSGSSSGINTSTIVGIKNRCGSYRAHTGIGIGADPGTTNGLTFDGTNFMDAYVKTTWTPVLRFGGASVGITYSAQTGEYQRIGPVIYFSLRIALTSKGSSTGTATISGLPTVAGGALASYGVNVGIASAITLTGGRTGLGGSINASTALITPSQYGSGIVSATLSDAEFANTSILNISGFYMVS